jgi:protein-S-isoprenylcysteine O-methyltransferase Ste14
MAGASFWTHWRVRTGYFVALAYLWLAAPSPRAIAAGGAVAFLGLIVRAAAAGHLRKGEALATSGPYAHTRNPLYLGSALLAAGFAIASHSWLAAALVIAYFALFYSMVMRREAGELRGRYGHSFEEYAARVPLFLPRIMPAPGGDPAVRFSWALYRRNREYQAALGYLVGIALLVVRMLWRG